MLKRYESQVTAPDLDAIITDLNALVGSDFVSASQEGSSSSPATIILDLKDDISAPDLAKVDLYMSNNDFGTDMFGRYYHYAEHVALQEMTSTAWVSMLDLTTVTVPVGKYFVTWSATVSGDTGANLRAKFEMDDDVGVFDLYGRIRILNVVVTSDRNQFSGFKQLTVGAKRVVKARIMMKSVDADTIRIKDAHMALWRVS